MALRQESDEPYIIGHTAIDMRLESVAGECALRLECKGGNYRKTTEALLPVIASVLGNAAEPELEYIHIAGASRRLPIGHAIVANNINPKSTDPERLGADVDWALTRLADLTKHGDGIETATGKVRDEHAKIRKLSRHIANVLSDTMDKQEFDPDDIDAIVQTMEEVLKHQMQVNFKGSSPVDQCRRPEDFARKVTRELGAALERQTDITPIFREHIMEKVRRITTNEAKDLFQSGHGR